MPCKTLHNQLPLFAGGELDAVQSALVGQHLQTCPRCRKDADAYSSDRAQLTRYGRELAHRNDVPDVFAAVQGRLAGLQGEGRAAARGPEARRRDSGFLA